MSFDRRWRGLRLPARALVLVVASCGDDDDNACLPAEVHGTCVEEVSRAGNSCFDPEGKCMWQSTDGGLEFEWQNGVRFEYAGFIVPDEVRIFGSDGNLCSETTRLSKDTCELGFHNAAGDDWVDTCARGDGEELEAVHYTCKNGREYDVPFREDRVQVAQCQARGPDIMRCVDKNAKRFGAK